MMTLPRLKRGLALSLLMSLAPLSLSAAEPGTDAPPAVTAPAVTAPAMTAPTVTAPAMTAPTVTAPAATPGEAPPAQVSTRELEATALYRIGLYVLGKGQLTEARQVFERVVQEYPGTEAVTLASTRIAEIAKAENLPAVDQKAQAEALANSGRAEFVVSQTIVGGFAGFMLPLAAQADSQNPYIGGVMGGTVLGLASALMVTSMHPLTETQAGLIYYSQVFTTLNTTMWTLALVGDNLENPVPVPALLGVAGGTVLGAFMAEKYKDIPAGRLSLVATSGIWMPVLSELVLITVGGDNLSGKVYQIAGPLMADVGIVGAAVLAQKFDVRVSRSRMRLINLGGGVGMLLGFGFAVIGSGSPQAAAALTLVGTGGGLLVGTLGTQGWDKQYHPELLAHTPTNSVLAFEQGKIRLGDPAPQLTWATVARATEQGMVTERTPRVSLNLFSGSF